MGEFVDASILLPTLNETFSFEETVSILLEENPKEDLREIIAIVCDRTEEESLKSIERSRVVAEEAGVPLTVLWQTRPFAGGAVADGMDAAKGSHTIMMAPDLETDPHTAKDLIAAAKQWPDDMTTCSRWLAKGAFEGYSKIKYVLNWMFQKMFSTYYHVKLSDITFGYRIAPTKLFQAIAWEETKHPFFLETLLKPVMLGVQVHEIPTTWKAREEGESQNSLADTFKYLGIAFRAKRESRDQILKEGVTYDA